MPREAEGGEAASSCHRGKQDVGVTRWQRGFPEVESGEREASLLEKKRWNPRAVDSPKLESVAGGGQGDSGPEEVQLWLVHLAAREVHAPNERQEAAKVGHLGEAVAGQVNAVQLDEGGEAKEDSRPGGFLDLPEVLEHDVLHIGKPPGPEERRRSSSSQVVARQSR